MPRGQQLALFGRVTREEVRDTAEFNIAVAVADTLRKFCKKDWLWTAIEAGELRDSETSTVVDGQGRIVQKRRSRGGERAKRKGVKPGWTDLLLISPTSIVHLLELKSHRGRLSPAQKELRDECLRLGHPWCCAWSYREAIEQLTAWGVLPTIHVQGAT